ncbi:MAG TPA: hypothetical protein VKM72_31930 [Thermoanaerobaculia bacterium]|nr:hypothetical protein [Thermoanaerobaculia bacterium]
MNESLAVENNVEKSQNLRLKTLRSRKFQDPLLSAQITNSTTVIFA